MDIEYISLRQCAEKILRLSKRMLQQAIDKQWDELSILEIDRGSALKYMFAHPDIEQNLPLLADILFEVLDIDKECIMITEKERFTLLQNLHYQNTNDRALNLYRTNSNSVS